MTDLAIPVSFLCLAGPCLAGGGPAWRPACCARGLNGRGLAGGWLAGDLPAAARLGPGRRHTAHTHKTHTPPHLERGEPGCVLTKLTPPLDADTSGDSEVLLNTHISHTPVQWHNVTVDSTYMNLMRQMVTMSMTGRGQLGC